MSINMSLSVGSSEYDRHMIMSFLVLSSSEYND